MSLYLYISNEKMIMNHIIAMGSKSRSAAFFYFFLLFLFASLPCWKPASAAASPKRWAAASNETEGGGRRCSSVEEDLEEFQFDSEINRRLLAGSGFSDVGHAALNANKAACSTNGGKAYQCGARSGNKPSPRSCGQNLYRCPHK
ncbi:hypothetical protein ZIOFF_014527 [Zingiber officinale]|uniref:Uncharacterized protein n=2 Tax=Zingiber officinale TaxID=94328 RepID=A0A8J5LDZ7_ZINOF|nr:hypothetical protein ZIOFF_014527 [Zingiber officinale]